MRGKYVTLSGTTGRLRKYLTVRKALPTSPFSQERGGYDADDTL